MSFDTAPFIGCFLPITVLLYHCIPGQRAKNALLTALGLLFYAFGSLQGLVLLLASAAVNYLLGLLLMRFPGHRSICAVAVSLNLAFLIFFQYWTFLLEQVLGLSAGKVSWAAPIGISFFTFKAISYLVDTYRDANCGSKRFGQVLLYLSFFPQVMAGPITRFSEFAVQLTRQRNADVAKGLRRFIVGLAKKLIFAGLLAKIADGVFAMEGSLLSLPLAWLGAIAYMLQIYFDFSGYSDMAVGLGRMFGFDTPENFQYPYIADSITDFWRRWHISLSLWFRDYLYIPLGGNRKGKNRTALNKFIVFTLCGLWHGAAWTFLLWGVWHGVFTALESRGWIAPKRWKFAFLRRIYTLLVVCLGFVLFRGATLQQGFEVIAAMFGGGAGSVEATVALHSLLTPAAAVVLLLGAVLCCPWPQWIGKRPKLQQIAEPLSYGGCLLLFVLCLLRLAAGGFAPFIYFQF